MLRSAARCHDLLSGHTQLRHQIQSLSHSEDHAFHHRSRQVGSAMTQSQAHEAGTRVRVHVWCPLADQIRLEEKAFGASRHRGSRISQRPVGCTQQHFVTQPSQ